MLSAHSHDRLKRAGEGTEATSQARVGNKPDPTLVEPHKGRRAAHMEVPKHLMRTQSSSPEAVAPIETADWTPPSWDSIVREHADRVYRLAYRLTGNPDKALEIAKRVVLARSRTLGPTHTDTLTSRLGLGLALAAAGETANAHRIVDKTLVDAREVLGVDDDHYLALVDCGFESGLLQADFS